MGKLTISMAIFNSYVSHNQRVYDRHPRIRAPARSWGLSLSSQGFHQSCAEKVESPGGDFVSAGCQVGVSRPESLRKWTCWKPHEFFLFSVVMKTNHRTSSTLCHSEFKVCWGMNPKQTKVSNRHLETIGFNNQNLDFDEQPKLILRETWAPIILFTSHVPDW